MGSIDVRSVGSAAGMDHDDRKELVESTAKLALRSRNIAYTKADDVPALVARAQEALKLNASGVEGADGEAKALKHPPVSDQPHPGHHRAS